jgi:hypothetical protein
MADLFAIAGNTVTLPGLLLGGPFLVLKAALALYDQVDTRRKRIGVHLDRCRDLIQKLTHYLSQPNAELSLIQRQGFSDLEG